MNWNTSKALGGGRILALLGLTGALLSTSGGTLTANGSGHEGPVGTWLVQVTRSQLQDERPGRAVIQLAGHAS